MFWTTRLEAISRVKIPVESCTPDCGPYLQLILFPGKGFPAVEEICQDEKFITNESYNDSSGAGSGTCEPAWLSWSVCIRKTCRADHLTMQCKQLLRSCATRRCKGADVEMAESRSCRILELQTQTSDQLTKEPRVPMAGDENYKGKKR